MFKELIYPRALKEQWGQLPHEFRRLLQYTLVAVAFYAVGMALIAALAAVDHSIPRSAIGLKYLSAFLMGGIGLIAISNRWKPQLAGVSIICMAVGGALWLPIDRGGWYWLYPLLPLALAPVAAILLLGAEQVQRQLDAFGSQVDAFNSRAQIRRRRRLR
ncbi:MAG: hypothetical protein ACKVOE_09485 [Rickettsiales bacterium]